MSQKIKTNVRNLLQMQEGGGRTGESKSVFDWSLYDSWRLGYSSEINLFVNPVGSTFDGAQRNKSDTNMMTSSLIPNGRKMVVKAIKVSYLPVTVKYVEDFIEIQKYLHKTIFEFQYDSKDVSFQVSLAELLGINLPLLNESYETEEDGINFVVSLLRDTVRDYYTINIPIELPSQQLFYARIFSFQSLSANNQNDIIRLSLSGYQASLN